MTRHRAIPLTTVARTLVDLADVLRAEALADVAHEAEVRRLLDIRAVEAAMGRANGRRGIAALRAALGESSPGMTRSEFERRFVALCRRGGLTPPRPNVHLPVGHGMVEVDALWVSSRVIVELDGEGAHRTHRAFHADRRRDAALAALGYAVVRLTWPRVVHEADDVLAELRQLLAMRPGSGVGARRPQTSTTTGSTIGRRRRRS